jgi:hypothetical protein
MLCYKEIYGDDADGNRGMAVINYEITDDDKDEVCEKLYDLFIDGETGEQCILMYCHLTGEDVSVEVDIDEYIDELIKVADKDEDIKDDEDLQEWLKELKKKQEVQNEQ